MQLFVLLPPLVFAFVRREGNKSMKIAAYGGAFAIIAASLMFCVWMIFLAPGVGASWCSYYVTGANTYNFMTVYYVKPWARASPYIIGAILAFAYRECMDKDGNVPKISTLKLYAGHVLCALGLFWGVFSTFWSWPTDPTVTDGCVPGHPYCCGQWLGC